MSPTALGLLLLAAVLHAGWNLLVKRAKEIQVFTWWGLLAGSICFLPIVLFSPLPPIQVWPYLACSALLEAIYYIALTQAYKSSDFSLVYPIARGAAPAFLVLWSTLFLGEHPRLSGLIGVGLIVLGLIVVGGSTWWAQRSKVTVSMAGIVIALAAALCISIYSAIDGFAVRLTAPAPYTVLVIALSVLFVTPVLLLRYKTRIMVVEWRANWVRIIIVGFLMLFTYMLVLQVYSFSRVSYAGAIREASIIFAALAGWLWLREGFGGTRVLGSILLFVGIVVIAVAG